MSDPFLKRRKRDAMVGFLLVLIDIVDSFMSLLQRNHKKISLLQMVQSEVILGSAGGQQVNIGVGRGNLKPLGSDNTEDTEESKTERSKGEIESTEETESSEGESVEDFKEQIVPNEQSRGGREIDRQDEENKGTDVSVEAKEEERIIDEVEEDEDYYDDVWDDYEDYDNEPQVEKLPKVDFARWVGVLLNAYI